MLFEPPENPTFPLPFHAVTKAIPDRCIDCRREAPFNLYDFEAGRAEGGWITQLDFRHVGSPGSCSFVVTWRSLCPNCAPELNPVEQIGMHKLQSRLPGRKYGYRHRN